MDEIRIQKYTCCNLLNQKGMCLSVSFKNFRRVAGRSLRDSQLPNVKSIRWSAFRLKPVRARAARLTFQLLPPGK